MTYRSFLMAGAAVALLSTSPAFADCAAEIASLSEQSGTTVAAGEAAGGTVSKDGSQAPLEQVAPASGSGTSSGGAEGATVGETSGPAARAAGVATEGSDSGGQVSKDGSTIPLAEEGAAPAAETAMSQQDADAQQAGGATAADQDTASSTQASMSGQAMEALNRARAAERAGDEAGCMKAIEEAKAAPAG